MSDLAPIILFVYNRPQHTMRTLESLHRNNLADRSELYIYADGPNSDASKDNLVSINRVREVIRGKKWCHTVHIIENTENRGLAASIIEGTNQIVNRYGKAIILEDDLITSPFFLKYMNQALTIYAKNENVMQICGYMLPIQHKGLRETLFLRLTSSWGWATWARAWKYFESDAGILEKSFSEQDKQTFNLDGAYDYYSFFKLHRENKINSWAIRWYASVFLRNGLCLHPSRSLVYNCGHDDSGIHSKKTDIFETQLMMHEITDFNDQIKEDREALGRIQKYYLDSNKGKSGHGNIVRRIFQGLDKLKRLS